MDQDHVPEIKTVAYTRSAASMDRGDEVSAERTTRVVTAGLRGWSRAKAQRQHLFRVSRLFISCYYVYVSYYGLFILDLNDIEFPTLGDHGSNWRWKCVSVWNLILQISYFIYCTVFVDFANSGPGKLWIKPHLRQNKKIRDFVFISLVFPVSIVVCVMFWIICAINKPLLFPNEMSKWIPDWYNHAVHTNPIALTLFDMATTKHQLPKKIDSTAGLFLLSGSYVICLLYNKFMTGRWVYLIIGEIVSSLMEVIMYFAVTAFVIPFICMMIGYKLCSWFSNQRIKEEQKMI
ncbi:androgen-induced gene 1 protein-like [Sipha flava]|uniref:Androgen-induced gene 1 protein-like n=1 Tax=Sipha flava TaxID=143950 RepID=A0A2S2R4G3_9HEMI|nr:androgen-induced gene 1 protein-like [Sipha flava]